jgi:hypothetical protein
VPSTSSDVASDVPSDITNDIASDVTNDITSDVNNDVTTAMLQALRESVRTGLYRQLWQSYIDTRTKASPSAQSTPIASFVQLVTYVWRAETPERQSGSLPLGMLELTRDLIRNYRNNVNFERLQTCVYIVDELALAYTDGSMRDARYTQLFQEISISLRHIYGRPERMIESPTAPPNVPANEDPTWLKKLEATCRDTSEAGRPLDKPQVPLDRGVERRGTALEGVLHRILGRTPTVVMEDKV